MRIKICRKEAKEARYWLRLIDLDNKPEIPVTFLLKVTEIPTPLKLDGTNQLNPDVIEDIAIICYYSISID